MGFHHDFLPDDIEAGFRAALADPAFDDAWSIHQTGVNWGVFSLASEAATLMTMLQFEGLANKATLDQFMNEANAASANMLTLFINLMTIIVQRYFGPEATMISENINAASWKEVTIPFFFEIEP